MSEVSCMGRQSMSARRPTARPLPLFLPFTTPTTPVLASPRCTSMPHAPSFSATICEVRFSWKESSGCAWISRRMSRRSAWNLRIWSTDFLMRELFGCVVRRVFRLGRGDRPVDPQARVDGVVEQVDDQVDDDEKQRDQAQ